MRSTKPKGDLLTIRIFTTEQEARGWAAEARGRFALAVTVRTFARNISVDGIQLGVWVVVVRKATS